jgi:thiol-disulfide isomerase/thioredoxin
MAIKKKHIYNILFFGFLLFLFTPYGLGTRAKLTQGITYVKSFVFPPSANKSNERKALDTYDVKFKAVAYANDTNLEALKGKVVFINHWATWCPPCRAEMPSLQKLYSDYNDKTEFIFATAETKKVVDRYYSAKEFNLPTYNIVSKVPQQINTNSLPATFILDKEGKVFLDEFGAADWNSSKVRKLLDELLAE